MFRLNIPEITRFQVTPKNIALIIGACVLLLVGYGLHVYFAESAFPVSGAYFYSTDNGSTFFRSNNIQIPPFTADGKTALEAGVFVDAQGKPFVAYVYSYVTRGQEILRGLPHVAGQVVDNSTMRMQASKYCFVRRPGAKKWVPWNSPAGQKIINVRDPVTGKPLRAYHGG